MPRVHTAAVARGLSYSRPGLQSSKKAIMAPSCGPQEGPVRRGKGKELQPPRRRDAHDRNTAARRRSRASWLAVRACEAHPSLRALRNGDLQALVRGPSAPGRAPPSSPTARSPLWLVGRNTASTSSRSAPFGVLRCGWKKAESEKALGFPRRRRQALKSRSSRTPHDRGRFQRQMGFAERGNNSRCRSPAAPRNRP